MKSAGSPIQAAMGWIEPGGSRKDAMEYARGWAHKWMDAPETCWFAVLPMMGGYLWEVQEAGPGLSYLPAAAKVLSTPDGKGWFKIRKRIHQVSMMDGRPSLVFLPEPMSKAVMETGVGEMAASGKMHRVVKRGTKVLAFGGAMLGTGSLFLTAAFAHSILSNAYAPEPRRLDQDLLPHRQWSRVERVPPNLFVETMRFQNQLWTTNIKPVTRTASGRPVQTNAGAPQPAAAAVPTPTAAPTPAVAPAPAPQSAPAATVPPPQPPRQSP